MTTHPLTPAVNERAALRLSSSLMGCIRHTLSEGLPQSAEEAVKIEAAEPVEALRTWFFQTLAAPLRSGLTVGDLLRMSGPPDLNAAGLLTMAASVAEVIPSLELHPDAVPEQDARNAALEETLGDFQAKVS